MGRFNRIVDEELKIVASTAFTTTASTTAVNIESIGAGEETVELMVDVTAVAGTFDGSNYYTVELLASETSGGTYYPITDAVINAVDVKLLTFNTRQVAEALGAKGAYYKLTVTKVGSTATGVTLSAYIVKGL